MGIKTSEVLRNAKALITEPSKWTTQALARNAVFDKVLPDDPGAVCFCSIGAILKASSTASREGNAFYPFDEEREAKDALGMFMYGSVARFNDTRGHVDVLMAFDQAILFMESREERE